MARCYVPSVVVGPHEGLRSTWSSRENIQRGRMFPPQTSMVGSGLLQGIFHSQCVEFDDLEGLCCPCNESIGEDVHVQNTDVAHMGTSELNMGLLALDSVLTSQV